MGRLLLILRGCSLFPLKGRYNMAFMAHRRTLLSAVLAAVLAALAVAASAQFIGETEFLSVKTARANLREEPEKKAPLMWRLWKYMPVEVVAYKGDWVRVRDLDGDEGWMERSVLHETPTVMVARKEAELRAKPGGKVVWLLERGYSLRVFAEQGEWLEVSDLSTASGWVLKSSVWGFPPPRKAL